MLVSYPAVFENSEKYGCSVMFPDLNDLATEGSTYKEALSMAAEALASYLWDLKRTGQTVPAPSSAKDISLENGEYSVLISVDPEVYASKHFREIA